MVASHAGVFRDEKRAPLKTPAWEASVVEDVNKKDDFTLFSLNFDTVIIIIVIIIIALLLSTDVFSK